MLGEHSSSRKLCQLPPQLHPHSTAVGLVFWTAGEQRDRMVLRPQLSRQSGKYVENPSARQRQGPGRRLMTAARQRHHFSPQECYLESDQTSLYHAAKGLMTLQALYGTIPQIFGKGECARVRNGLCLG